MTVLRRRLRVWAMAWLVLQVASLAAVMPRVCCAAHRPETQRLNCHEQASAVHCPMRAANGTTCPMHRTGRAPEQQRSTEECLLRGTCNEPMAALFTILSNHGVLPDSPTILGDSQTGIATSQFRESLTTSRLAAPDPPPPRA